MTIFDRLTHWQERGVISPEQHTLLTGLSRGEPFSLFLELNILLYAGVLAFIGGLGWTVSTCSEQLGTILVLALLTAMLAAAFWYVFSRAPAWSPSETKSPSLIYDYVLYLASLLWSVELAFIETQFQILQGNLDLYFLMSAGLFFVLAYRFDNRLVLSLALSSLAGWFGLTISHWPSRQDDVYRGYAILYALVLGIGGYALKHRGVKAHFFGTYLNLAANVLFWALLSGVFDDERYLPWFLALLAASAASLAYGLKRREFSFVAYAAVYGYIGVSSILLRAMNESTGVLMYFFITGIAMLSTLVKIARKFGKEA